MSIFSKLFSGGISQVIDSVSGVIDNFTLSKEEKQEFKLEMHNRMVQLEMEAEESYRAELESRTEIIKAEMAQGDLYTKRARPTIVYIGLLFIFIVHVLVPVVAYLTGGNLTELSKLNLPAEFWWAWGTVVSVYGVGRTAEKMGISNKVTNLATGSGAYKIDNSKIMG